MKKTGLANGNERGDRVADDWHPDEPVPRLRYTGQFEGQRINFAPIDEASQREIGHDRHDERFIDAVALAKSLQAAFGVNVSIRAVDQVCMLIRNTRQM